GIDAKFVPHPEPISLGAKNNFGVGAENEPPFRLRVSKVNVWREAAADRRKLLAQKCLSLEFLLARRVFLSGRKLQPEAQRRLAVPPRVAPPEEAILARDDDVAHPLAAARSSPVFE